MSASCKFDLSSGSPDKALHASRNRGSYGTPSLDRSGGIRENMENPLLSCLPNMTRTNSSITQGDVLNFFQCVRVDPKSMVVDHKLNRPAEFKRLASAAVGIPLEDSLTTSSKGKQLSTPSLEDLRRLKSGVRESGTKSRERVKIFNDCLSVINKCFPTIPSRKRSRIDALSNDRSNTLLSIDRTAFGMGIGKTSSQNHARTNGFELEQQKPEERTNISIPSKRTRTSLVDARMVVRANNPSRPSGGLDNDRDITIFSDGSTSQGDTRSLSMAVDGWENSKMKKKRTGIKLDAGNLMMAKPIDGYREPKQGMHLRLTTEPRSRSIDAQCFRPGCDNEGLGAGKTEATMQTSSGMNTSISRTDSDSTSLLHERRDRPIGQERENVNLKAVNKANSREDLSSGSPTSGSKLRANIRAPRSGSVGGTPRLPPVVHRSTSSNDWDFSNCINKIPIGLGTHSRKRTPSARSSSPVANWAKPKRPQKISRTARRTNLLPIVPGNDENPILDATADMMAGRRFAAGFPQEVKIKSDNFSPAALSESEESGATEIKSREKNKRCDEIDEKSCQNVQKMSTLLLPPRKHKAVNGDNYGGDGIRRQGRTVRGFTTSVEKHGNVGTITQIRSSRFAPDKGENRVGRPPSRKLSDRKPYTRQKHINVNARADFLVGSDDGVEELLAAANAVTNTAQALSSSFWKMMEPLFRFISVVDISYLNDQVNPGFAVDTPAPAPPDAGSCTLLPNSCGSNGFGREETEARSVERSPEHSALEAKPPNEISLYQRLIAALIPEEAIEIHGRTDSLRYNIYGSHFEMEKDIECDTLCSQMSPSSLGYAMLNGYDVNANERSLYELEHSVSTPDTGVPICDHLHTDQTMPGMICSDYQYYNLPINERLLLAVHSIGIYPDLVSGDEEINGDINSLDKKYQKQISRKKSILVKLLNSVSEAKELQEKEFESHALDKLVGMAYDRYMRCWGQNSQGTKNTSSKIAKQAALAFVTRSLEGYQEFVVTGKSCFDDPLYRDMFLSGVLHLVDGQPLNSSADNESNKLNFGISGCLMGVGTPAPVGTQQSLLANNQETYSFDAFLPVSEQIAGTGGWPSKMKRSEMLLDGGSLSCSAKGKRSERESLGGNRSGKIGLPANSQRKSKAKSKPKTTTHLSVDHEKGVFSPSQNSEMLEDHIDLSGLQLPEMDDLGGQGEDIGSWLNIDDDGLHDHDFMGGLGIPMDDLSDLNMMV